MPDVLSKRFVLCLVVAGSLSVACGSGANPPTPTPTTVTSATATPTPTATPSAESQVSAAYLAYWEAYSQAVLNLDMSLMSKFAAGEELASIQAEIDGHRRDGVAARINVKHDFAIVELSERTATVVDQVTSQSFFVDPITKKPDTSDVPGRVLRYTFFMEKTPNGWVVVRGLKESPS
ncbi:MAG: hypothetical protein C4558_02335 [Dehalococcoidia bacterium]|nr:MAG: hypothetical protein C4558_02335 [Dehalococcoidia bacterium]